MATLWLACFLHLNKYILQLLLKRNVIIREQERKKKSYFLAMVANNMQKQTYKTQFHDFHLYWSNKSQTQLIKESASWLDSLKHKSLLWSGQTV